MPLTKRKGRYLFYNKLTYS